MRLLPGTLIAVGAIAVALAALVYMVLPLTRADAAGLACQMTMSGDGSYAVEWKPLPPARWDCIATPDGEPTRVIDLGWWGG